MVAGEDKYNDAIGEYEDKLVGFMTTVGEDEIHSWICDAVGEDEDADTSRENEDPVEKMMQVGWICGDDMGRNGHSWMKMKQIWMKTDGGDHRRSCSKS